MSSAFVNNRRTASLKPGLSTCFLAQAIIASERAAGIRMPRSGSVPVAGRPLRPLFLRLTDIDCFIYYVKRKLACKASGPLRATTVRCSSRPGLVETGVALSVRQGDERRRNATQRSILMNSLWNGCATNSKTAHKSTDLGLTGGRGGIRTRDTVSRIHTFQACALNHSATLPRNRADYTHQTPRYKFPLLSHGRPAVAPLPAAGYEFS